MTSTITEMPLPTQRLDNSFVESDEESCYDADVDNDSYISAAYEMHNSFCFRHAIISVDEDEHADGFFNSFNPSKSGSNMDVETISIFSDDVLSLDDESYKYDPTNDHSSWNQDVVANIDNDEDLSFASEEELQVRRQKSAVHPTNIPKTDLVDAHSSPFQLEEHAVQSTSPKIDTLSSSTSNHYGDIDGQSLKSSSTATTFLDDCSSHSLDTSYQNLPPGSATNCDRKETGFADHCCNWSSCDANYGVEQKPCSPLRDQQTTNSSQCIPHDYTQHGHRHNGDIYSTQYQDSKRSSILRVGFALIAMLHFLAFSPYDHCHYYRNIDTNAISAEAVSRDMAMTETVATSTGNTSSWKGVIIRDQRALLKWALPLM